MLVITPRIGRKNTDGSWAIEPEVERLGSLSAHRAARKRWKILQREKPHIVVAVRPREELEAIDKTQPSYRQIARFVEGLLAGKMAALTVATRVDPRTRRVVPRWVVEAKLGDELEVGFDLGCMLIQPDRFGLVFIEADSREGDNGTNDPASPKVFRARRARRAKKEK